MSNATETRVTTGRVRFSYASLFHPRSVNGGPEKYSVTLLIPKADKKTMDKIRRAIAAATEQAKEKIKKFPLKPTNTVHDGDGLKDSGDPYGEECKGCYVIAVSSTRKPTVIDRDKMPITDEDELYSGCYGRAVINFYGYDAGGKKGISAGLNGVMKLADGERLGGGGVSDEDWDDDFDDVEGDEDIF